MYYCDYCSTWETVRTFQQSAARRKQVTVSKAGTQALVTSKWPLRSRRPQSDVENALSARRVLSFQQDQCKDSTLVGLPLLLSAFRRWKELLVRCSL